MPRETTWSVPRAWEGETAFIIGGGPSGRGFDAEVLRGRGRVIAINEAGFAATPEAAETTPHAPWADVLYWADKTWLEGNHVRLGEHTGPYKIARHAPTLKEKPAPWLTEAYDIKVLPQARPCEQLSVKTTELGGFCGGGACINLAYLFGARRIVLLFFDMGWRGGRKHWHNLPGRAPAPGSESYYRTRYMPAIAAMAWPLRQAGVEVINCTPGSALICFPIRPLEEVLMDDKLKSGAPIVSHGRPEDFEGLPEAQPGGIKVIPGGESVFDEPGYHRGLELCPAQHLPGQIDRLKQFGKLRVVVRLSGADVVTRRSATWWLRKLSVSFAYVVPVEIPGGDGRAIMFCCEAEAPKPEPKASAPAAPVIASGAGSAEGKS